VPLDATTAGRILAAYNGRRRGGPPATLVAARKNRRTLVSVRRLQDGRVRLNVAQAVVEAGPDAWALLGPALGGEPEARRRLTILCRDGLRTVARAREARRAVRSFASRMAPPLPDTRCQGTEREQRILHRIIEWVRSTSGAEDHFPDHLQVRVSRRMSSTYGSHMTRGGTHRITISHRLFRAGLEDILLDTVLHELAHLLDALTNGRGRSFHNASWKRWCRRLGAVPQRLIPKDAAERVRAAQEDPTPGDLPPEVARWTQRRS